MIQLLCMDWHWKHHRCDIDYLSVCSDLVLMVVSGTISLLAGRFLGSVEICFAPKCVKCATSSRKWFGHGGNKLFRPLKQVRLRENAKCERAQQAFGNISL